MSDLKQLLARILFRLVNLGQPRLEVVGLGCWKAEKTKVLEWQRKVCSVERMEMFIESGFSEEAEPSGEVPGSVLGGKQRSALQMS